jgi:hypothetical protein
MKAGDELQGPMLRVPNLDPSKARMLCHYDSTADLVCSEQGSGAKARDEFGIIDRYVDLCRWKSCSKVGTSTSRL